MTRVQIDDPLQSDISGYAHHVPAYRETYQVHVLSRNPEPFILTFRLQNPVHVIIAEVQLWRKDTSPVAGVVTSHKERVNIRFGRGPYPGMMHSGSWMGVMCYG